MCLYLQGNYNKQNTRVMGMYAKMEFAYIRVMANIRKKRKAVILTFTRQREKRNRRQKTH